MSLLKQAMDMADAGARRANSYFMKGAFHNFGADPTKMMSTGSVQMNFWGRQVAFYNDQVLPKIGAPSQMTAWEKTAATMGVMGTAYSAASGFAEGGVLSALRNVTWDVGVDAAMVKHGYNMSKADAAGIRTFNKGNVNPRMLGGKAMGVAGFMGRMTVGNIMAQAVGHTLGGGLVGTAGALLGGSLGVRHAGKLAIGFAGYQGAKMVARGTSSILRAGNDHYQGLKRVDTDGSMAAFQTQASNTMRSRAVQAIQRSHSNSRSALGKEASYLTSQRNYFSPYRQF